MFAKTLVNAATAALVAAVSMLAAAPAAAQDVIKIGEINSYKAQPAFLEPYRKGMELAVEQVNAAGGVNGKKLELVIRDRSNHPSHASTDGYHEYFLRALQQAS